MGIGPSLQAFEEVFPTLPYDSFTPTGTAKLMHTLLQYNIAILRAKDFLLFRL